LSYKRVGVAFRCLGNFRSLLGLFDLVNPTSLNVACMTNGLVEEQNRNHRQHQQNCGNDVEHSTARWSA